MDLASWMAATGLDDAQLAEKATAQGMPITRVTISRVRRHKQEPSPNLARALRHLSDGNVTLNDLYGVEPLPEEDRQALLRVGIEPICRSEEAA